MPTLTKPKKQAPGRVMAKKAPCVDVMGPRRSPPPARGTVADLLAMGDGYGKGADWEIIRLAHAARE